MNIVHDAPSGVTTSPHFAARMARADSCPEACGNLEVPRSVAPTNNGFRAAYLCSGCGHAWTTDWMEDDA